MIIGSPVLVAGMIVGLVIGLFQTLTQIQEQSVVFVPKIIVMLLVLSVCVALADRTDAAIYQRPDRRHPGKAVNNLYSSRSA